MALGRSRIRFRRRGGAVQVRMIVSHPMHTGTVKNKKTGNKIPRHHITSVSFKVNGTNAAQMKVGPAVSKDAYFSIYLKASKGDTLTVVIKDSKGKSWTKNVKVNK